MATLSLGLVFPLHQSKHLPKGTGLSSFSAFLPQKAKSPNTGSRLRSPHCSTQHLMRSPPTHDKDFQITVDRSVLVSPTEPTERKTCFLSNIDHLVNFMTHTVQFFDRNPDFPFETVVSKYEMAYRKVLVQYDFMAGRLKWNSELGRLEIDCNSAGAGFVVASSELRLEDLGDLVCPKPGYQQLAPRKLKSLHSKDQPLVIIQLTSFACGGFAIGYSINHLALDGASSIFFGKNIASLLENNHLVLPPYNNRHLLAARSPPQVDFPHPELISLESIKKGMKNPIPFKATFQKLECKVFNLSANDIIFLNELAKMDIERKTRSPNIFDLVAAHIWRCIALVRNSENDPEKTSTMLYAVNIRPRVRPRLPTSYTGNGILNAYCTATCRVLNEQPISRIVEMVSQAATTMTNEYIRSTIDHLEVNKMTPYGDVQLSSWLKHGMNDAKFPWGWSKWSTPVLGNHGNNAIILLPDIKSLTNGGVNVLVSLPHKEMEKFQRQFYNFQ